MKVLLMRMGLQGKAVAHDLEKRAPVKEILYPEVSPTTWQPKLR